MKKNKIWDSLLFSFSMFTTFPVTKRYLDAESKYVMLFFPLTGLYVSLIGLLIYYLTSLLDISLILRTALVLLSLIAATGAIHLDGFADTADAIFSRQDSKRMLEIMHDVHVGAFAVISLFLVLFLQFAALESIFRLAEARILFSLLPLPLLLRTISALYSISLPSARQDGMHVEFSSGEGDRSVRFVLKIFLLILSAIFILIGHFSALLSLIAVLIFAYFFARYSVKTFSGTTGDLAGFLLIILQTISLLVLALSHSLPSFF